MPDYQHDQLPASGRIDNRFARLDAVNNPPEYRIWVDRRAVVMRQTHRFGEKLFVDYPGQPAEVIDRTTGEICPAQVFVAVLSASNDTDAEATWTQQLPDWIGAHVRAFAFFGGVPERLIPDNLNAAGQPLRGAGRGMVRRPKIALKEGIDHPAFGVAITLAFIVMLDAGSLRRQVGQQAVTINRLAAGLPDHQTLRERMGHTRLEIAAGIGVGIGVAAAVNAVL